MSSLRHAEPDAGIDKGDLNNVAEFKAGRQLATFAVKLAPVQMRVWTS